MCSRDQSKWDASRFFATLNYFGEVPFIGSFRWMQQWLGQTSVVSGMTLNAKKKKVAVIGTNCSARFVELRSQLAPSVDMQFYDLADDLADDLPNDSLDDLQAEILGSDRTSRPFSSKLQGIVREADTLVVLNVTDSSDLIPNLAAYFKKIPSFIETSIFDFSNAEDDLSAWGALDDVVMGGVSQGRLFKQAEQAVFAGNVSTNNSGGFSSVRTRNFEPPFNFVQWRGLRLRVKGDGQRYKFILRNSDGWDSPAYIFGFNTHENVWMDVEVPFGALMPTFRARSVPNASAFDPAKVYSFQLMLSKFEIDRQLNPHFVAGPFELAVRSISAYRDRQAAPLVFVGVLDEGTRTLLRTHLDEGEVKVPYRVIEPDTTELAGAIAQAINEPAL